VIVLGAIPSSGLTDNAPTLTKIVGVIAAALTAINYTLQRSALKRSYYAAHAQLSRSAGRSSQVTTAATLLVLLGCMSALPSCGADCKDPKNANSAQCIVEGAVVDCTGVSSLPSAVAVVEPIIVQLITSARQPDGSINWVAIEQQIVDLALKYGTCVVAQVWNDLMGKINPSIAGSGAADLKLSPADLKTEFDRIRARVAPGRTFAIPGGKTL